MSTIANNLRMYIELACAFIECAIAKKSFDDTQNAMAAVLDALVTKDSQKLEEFFPMVPKFWQKKFRTYLGLPFLHITVGQKDFLGTRYLLEQGANPNELIQGIHPLQRIVNDSKYDKKLWLELFLKHGANPNIIVAKKTRSNLIHLVVVENDLTSLDLLLGAKADVNAQSILGFTPLMFAATFNNKEAVKKLMAAGARVDIRNSFSLTVTDMVKHLKDPELEVLLLPNQKQETTVKTVPTKEREEQPATLSETRTITSKPIPRKEENTHENKREN